MMLSLRQVFLGTFLLQVALAFSPSSSARVSRLVSFSSHPPLTTARMSSQSSGEEPEPEEQDASKPKKEGVDPMPPSQMMSTPNSPPPKRLDPLLASLTRVDSSLTANTPTTNIPLLGEVSLDKNLFIILPVVAFAILGFVSTFFVAYNARDVFVDALNTWNDSVLNPPPQPVVDSNECRGLCSSQEQDLEGLKTFMNSLGGKK